MEFNTQWGGFLISLITFICAGVGTFAGVIWKIAKHEEEWGKKFDKSMQGMMEHHREEIGKIIKNHEEDTKEKIEKHSKNTKEKIERQYERFDEFKKSMEATHVRKDMCEVMNKTSAMEIANVNKQLEVLGKKFDDLLQFLMKGKKDSDG